MTPTATTATTTKRQQSKMTDAHKKALAQGRTEGHAVRAYLEALDATKPRRGRKRNPDAIKARMADIDAALAGAEPLRRVSLIQERLDLSDELDALEAHPDLSALEAAFVKAAPGYSSRKGITYAAWRFVGVPAPVLKQAGVS